MKGAGLYVLGIFGLTGIAVAGIVGLEVGRPEGYNSAALTQIIAIVTPTLGVLVVLLRSAANAQAIEEVRQKQDVAVDVAVETKHDLGRKIEENTQLTAAGKELAKAAALAAGAGEAVAKVETHGPRPYPRAAWGDGPGGLEP